MSVLEAMATGLAVVATSVGGVPEVIRSGETGLLVPPAQSSGLAEAMETLLDRETRSRLGAEARSWVQANAALDDRLHALEGFYARALRRSSGEGGVGASGR